MKTLTDFYDVCVVGAGFAGFGAALTSARLGMKTLLIEKSAAWGGVARLGMHGQLCGLYPYTQALPKETLNEGISRELEEALRKKGHARIKKIGSVYVLEYDPLALQSYFKEQSETSENLEILFEAEVKDVDSSERQIKGIFLSHLQASHAVKCGALIDASGSGAVLRLSGASYEVAPAEERQLAAYAMKLGAVQNSFEFDSLKLFYCLAKAVESGKLASHLRFGSWTPSQKEGEGVFRMSILPRDSEYPIEAIRDQARLIHEILKREIKEFKHSEIIDQASWVAEREGPRMEGLYRLTEEEIITGKKFEDSALKGAWPIEFWGQVKGPRYRYLDYEDYYEIPKRCLASKDFENLFAAGRCIAVSSRALASTRVTGTCLALGEASAKMAHSYLGTVSTA